MPKSIRPVSAVCLRRSGDYAIVEVEIDNQWFEIIREHLEGSFSHIAEAIAFVDRRTKLNRS